MSLVRLWGGRGGGTLTALTFLDHYLGLPARLGLAALCLGLVDAPLLYGSGGGTHRIGRTKTDKSTQEPKIGIIGSTHTETSTQELET